MYPRRTPQNSFSVQGNLRSSLTTLTCSSTHLVASSCDLWAPPGLAVSALDAVVLSRSLLQSKNQEGSFHSFITIRKLLYDWTYPVRSALFLQRDLAMTLTADVAIV